ncbi:sugar transferase [Microbacterium sp. 179-B 1A2 NHS]|uniref:sugar transferase n=1 Tax=Microbacterium sp. 179-B 1A2 NHS TaxID=3142383 RepID=UPI0039A3A45B
MPAVADASLALALTPRPTPEALRLQRARSRHRTTLLVTDAVALTVGVTVAASALLIATTAAAVRIVPGAVTVIAVFLLALAATHSREARIPAQREYIRTLSAAAVTFAGGACWVAFAPSADSRALLLTTIPVGFVAVLLGRMFWRRWAPASRRQRAPRTIVVGSRPVLEALVPTLHTDRRFSHDVVGTTLMQSDAAEAGDGPGGVPVLGTAAATAQIARAIHAETVIVAGPTHDPDFVRRLSWQLEGTAASLVLATPLTDVDAGRLTLDASDGLALVGVRIPTYDGAQHRVKRLLDVVTSLGALIPIILVTPIIALAIRLDSPGPVLFRQRRVGRDGREFDIVKFRTMRVGAERELIELAAQNEGAGALFKVRQDPRVTRVGRFLRKYSIDELPQFWNVLSGDMSVVGPRPPLPQEVRAYDVAVFRRLYLRPGITGPWQIGGRSDLSWDESVRLDLHYVENWSVVRDLAIMLRTATVVLQAKGAY